ncbi:3-oxoacyl-reductase [Pyrenochaeta sp. DS3sAY3a]|nr:3-oxoacyl-reductase [Pyrenochaeta sp. DS3sAY3a]
MPVNKSAIVTGGASGIGLATCKKLASRGVSILIADFQEDQGKAEASKLAEQYGVRVVFKCTDVSKEEDVKSMVEAAVEAFGRLDYAVNCAGICESVWDEEKSITTETVDRTYAINQRGVWLCQKYEAMQMQSQDPQPVTYTPSSRFPVPSQRGSIVNIGSLSAYFGMGLAAYTPSKHAVVGITRNGAKFYGPSGIRCNAVCPGQTLTPMLETSMGKAGEAGSEESRSDALLKRIPLGRMGFAEEQANVVDFLLGPESSYVNGVCLLVDGGQAVIK